MADFMINWVTMALLTPPLALRSEQLYRNLPQLNQEVAAGPLPSLSIIVPARNEAVNLRRLLPSLNLIAYPGPWEVIVVDDNSTDETPWVAKEFGVRVVCLDDLPAGWLGKPHASHQGALAASGDWLLFTDADTIHEPCGPAQAVSYALHHRLDGLSLFLNQVTSGVLDRLGLLVAFAGLFSGLLSTSLSHGSYDLPEDGTPVDGRGRLYNGQYILIRREVYEASGGFSAVADESLEDLALGQQLRAKGYRVSLARGERLANVQMYADKSGLWQGLTRLGIGSFRWLGLSSILTALFITGVMAPILAMLSSLRKRRNRKWALVSWIVVAFGFVPWARRFGSTWLAILAPFGALLVQLSALWGLASRLAGRGISWKGRSV